MKIIVLVVIASIAVTVFFADYYGTNSILHVSNYDLDEFEYIDIQNHSNLFFLKTVLDDPRFDTIESDHYTVSKYISLNIWDVRKIISQLEELKQKDSLDMISYPITYQDKHYKISFFYYFIQHTIDDTIGDDSPITVELRKTAYWTSDVLGYHNPISPMIYYVAHILNQT